LRLLGNFHYVVAGITALFASFPLIHVFLGFMMVTGRMGPKHPNGDTEQLSGRLQEDRQSSRPCNSPQD
jgi:hypothetical protein